MHTRFMLISFVLFLASIALSGTIYLVALHLGGASLGNAADHASLVPGSLGILLGVIAIYFYLRLEDPEMIAARDARARLLRVKAHSEAALFALNPVQRMLEDRTRAQEAVRSLKSRIKRLSSDDAFLSYAKSTSDFAAYKSDSSERRTVQIFQSVEQALRRDEGADGSNELVASRIALESEPNDELMFSAFRARLFKGGLQRDDSDVERITKPGVPSLGQVIDEYVADTGLAIRRYISEVLQSECPSETEFLIEASRRNPTSGWAYKPTAAATSFLEYHLTKFNELLFQTELPMILSREEGFDAIEEAFAINEFLDSARTGAVDLQEGQTVIGRLSKFQAALKPELLHAEAIASRLSGTS